MKKLLLIACILTAAILHGQENATPSDRFSVEGKVKKPFSFALTDARRYVSIGIDSVTIYNHQMQKKGVIKNIKGVLLKDIIEKAEIDVTSPKLLSEFYIECIATDNYKVVFSWNELFNSSAGYNILIITEKDGLKGEEMIDRICLLSSTDHATGRRYVKGLSRVVVRRVE